MESSQSLKPDHKSEFTSQPTIRRAIGYFGAFFVLGMVISSLGPTLPYLAEGVGTDLTDAGILISVRSMGYMLGALTLGRVYDRLPGNRVLLGVFSIFALTLIFIPLSPYLVLMGALLFVSGICLSGVDVGSNAMTIWMYGARSGPYINGLFLFAGMGGLVIPLIVGWLVQGGYQIYWAYWIMAILMLPVIAWLAFQPSPSPPQETGEAAGGKVDYGLVALFASLFFLVIGIETSFGGWIYSYLLSNGLAEVRRASLVNSLFWGALTVGRIIAIPVAARLQPFIIIRINMLGALLSLGLILFAPYHLVTVTIGVFGLGVSLASSIPTVYSIARGVMPISGRLTGLLWASGSLGAIITPWTIGQLMERFSPRALVVTTFSYVLVAVAILFIYWIRFSRPAKEGIVEVKG